jgi:hypothetical protein
VEDTDRPHTAAGHAAQGDLMSYVKTYAKIFGWVFIAVGVVGFFLTGFGGFFGMEGEHLLFFEINPAHNIIHLAIGVVYLLGARAGEAGTRAVVMVLSATYFLVGVLGLLLIDTPANILALNQADNILHLGTGALGFAVLAIDRSRRTQPTTA